MLADVTPVLSPIGGHVNNLVGAVRVFIDFGFPPAVWNLNRYLDRIQKLLDDNGADLKVLGEAVLPKLKGIAGSLMLRHWSNSVELPGLCTGGRHDHIAYDHSPEVAELTMDATKIKPEKVHMADKNPDVEEPAVTEPDDPEIEKTKGNEPATNESDGPENAKPGVDELAETETVGTKKKRETREPRQARGADACTTAAVHPCCAAW